MNLFFSCHGIKTEWSRICSMQLQLQSMHRSRRSDLCLHFIQSRRDITQRGCAYLCAVAQHTVRYLKLWTFGIGGVCVWGGGGTPLAFCPAQPATADFQLLIISSICISIFPRQAPSLWANPIIRPCYGPIHYEFCMQVHYVQKEGRKSRRSLLESSILH